MIQYASADAGALTPHMRPHNALHFRIMGRRPERGRKTATAIALLRSIRLIDALLPEAASKEQEIALLNERAALILQYIVARRLPSSSRTLDINKE